MKVLQAIAFVHERFHVIMNLKSSNIFIDSNSEPKICDLGIETLIGFEKPDPKCLKF